MLNCKEVTALSSAALDRPLRFRERLAVRLHLFRCHLCSRYARQLRFIHRACRLADAHQVEEPRLSDEARARIRANLKSPK